MRDEMKSMYSISICKPQMKRPNTKPKCRWWDNITVNLKGKECVGVWKGFLLSLVANCCEYGAEPAGCIKGGKSLDSVASLWSLSVTISWSSRLKNVCFPKKLCCVHNLFTALYICNLYFSTVKIYVIFWHKCICML